MLQNIKVMAIKWEGKGLTDARPNLTELQSVRLISPQSSDSIQKGSGMYLYNEESKETKYT